MLTAFKAFAAAIPTTHLARKVLPAWKPEVSLREGLTTTYQWIEKQVYASRNGNSAQLDWNDKHGVCCK
jgi:hypothetical protein